MTPKERAQELFDKFNDAIPANSSNNPNEFIMIDVLSTKDCGLIAIDEILNILNAELCNPIEYWKDVKNEFINL